MLLLLQLPLLLMHPPQRAGLYAAELCRLAGASTVRRGGRRWGRRLDSHRECPRGEDRGGGGVGASLGHAGDARPRLRLVEVGGGGGRGHGGGGGGGGSGRLRLRLQ